MADSLADREGNAGYKAPRAALSLGDFELVKRLGDGSYSQVVQARHKGSRKSYALKIVDKHLIQRHKMVAYIRNERHILDRLDHPGVVNLCFTFQDATSLYLGQELCPNGELYDQIQRRGRLQLEDTQFYTAEIVEILDYLQQCQVVHRDLKPENLMLDVNGHIKLIDFGSAKSLGDGEASEASPEGEARRSNSSESRRATSLVGTADYVAPETLSNQAITPAYDLWSLGCVVYQMLVGRPPFKDASEYLTFQRIAAADYTLPDDLPPVALDLIKQLLVLEPEKRLGVGLRGLDELREHAFFDSVHWEHIWETAAPAIAPPRNTSRELDEKGLDWEMQSLAAALPVVYHYEPTEEGVRAEQEYQAALAATGRANHDSDAHEQHAEAQGHSPVESRQHGQRVQHGAQHRGQQVSDADDRRHASTYGQYTGEAGDMGQANGSYHGSSESAGGRANSDDVGFLQAVEVQNSYLAGAEEAGSTSLI